MTFPPRVTVVVQRQTAEDRHGDKTFVDDHELPGCVLYPRAKPELEDRRDTVIIGLGMLAPPGADVLATDRIKLPDATVYRVDGEPGKWPSGVEVALERVVG